jgi:hypothetical protein
MDEFRPQSGNILTHVRSIGLLWTLCICGFFNDAVSSWYNVALSDRLIVNEESERRRNEALVAWLGVIFRHLSGGTEENKEEKFPFPDICCPPSCNGSGSHPNRCHWMERDSHALVDCTYFPDVLFDVLHIELTLIFICSIFKSI